MEGSPTPPQRRRRPWLPARLLGAGVRSGASAAAEVARSTGLDRTLEEAVEDAVVRALESPATERAIARALESPAVERTVEKALDSEAVERAVVRVLESELLDRTWERLLASDEAQKLVERVAQAPEVRSAIAYQGVGLIEDVGQEVGKVARSLDEVVEDVARRVLRRPRRSEPARNAGFVSRALALAADAAIINGILLLGALALGAIAREVFGLGEAGTEAVVAGAGAWIVFGGFYIVSFWGLSGQTPGMRFIGLRLKDEDGGRRIGRRRAFRRLYGMALSVLTLGLGFLPALTDARRRGLPDRMAGTEVLYAFDRET